MPAVANITNNGLEALFSIWLIVYNRFPSIYEHRIKKILNERMQIEFECVKKCKLISLIQFCNAVVYPVEQNKSCFRYWWFDINCPLAYCSTDAIQRAWQIVDQIPGRATGAYSHSQVLIGLSNFGLFLCYSQAGPWNYSYFHVRVSRACVIQ